MKASYQKFVAEYIKDPTNGIEAVLRAGFKQTRAAAAVTATRLLKIANVKEAILAGLQRSMDNAEVTRERILRNLLNVAELDPLDLFNHDGTMKALKDMPANARKAISSIESDDFHANVKKVRFHPKVEALALLAKTVKGLIVSSHEVTGRNGAPLVPPALGTPINFENFTKADIFRIAGIDMNGNGHSSQ